MNKIVVKAKNTLREGIFMKNNLFSLCCVIIVVAITICCGGMQNVCVCGADFSNEITAKSAILIDYDSGTII